MNLITVSLTKHNLLLHSRHCSHQDPKPINRQLDKRPFECALDLASSPIPIARKQQPIAFVRCFTVSIEIPGTMQINLLLLSALTGITLALPVVNSDSTPGSEIRDLTDSDATIFARAAPSEVYPGSADYEESEDSTLQWLNARTIDPKAKKLVETYLTTDMSDEAFKAHIKQASGQSSQPRQESSSDAIKTDLGDLSDVKMGASGFGGNSFAISDSIARMAGPRG